MALSGQTRSQAPQPMHLSRSVLGIKVRQSPVLLFTVDPGLTVISMGIFFKLLFFKGYKINLQFEIWILFENCKFQIISQ
jgi:hypothetical protein